LVSSIYSYKGENRIPKAEDKRDVQAIKPDQNTKMKRREQNA